MLIQFFIMNFFLILTIIQYKKEFKKGKLEPIRDELKRWKGTKENFIKFKEYQYNQTFWLVLFQLTFAIFLAGITISLEDLLTSIIGLYSFLTLLCCNILFIAKFCILIVPSSHNKAVENIKILLEFT